MRLSITALLVISIFGASPTSAQNLKLPVSNYTNQVYGREYDATSRCIITDHRNFIYAGNANGILEYDGGEWRFIPVRQGAYVTSLATDFKGTIYVGSQNEFGILEPDASGNLVYLSISDSLDEFDRFFSVVWDTHSSDERVYFQSEEILFIYQEGAIIPVYPESSFHTSFLVGQKLYVRERSKGLMVLEEEELKLVNGGSEFSETGIFAMFPMDNSESIFIATREKGFFSWHPEKGIRKVQSDNEEFLIKSGITGGIALSDGNYALNTLHEGVIVISQQGKIQAIINRHAGLQVDDVKSICQDAFNNIWCALGNGIGKIDYASPVSFYHENAGLEGSIHSVARFNKHLWVGTTGGLFIENRTDDINRSLDFSSFPSIRDQVWDLLPLGNSLMIATGNGLYQLENGRLDKISEDNSFVLHYLEDEALLFAGGSGGLSAYRKKVKWEKVVSFPEISQDVKSIAVNHASLYDATEIWIGSSYQGVAKILMNKDLSYESYTYQGENDGLSPDWVLPMNHGDSLVFGTRIGLMQFVDEMIIRDALPDSLKDNPEYNRGYFEGMPLFGNPVITPCNYLVDSDHKTWVVIDNEISLISHAVEIDVIRKPFKKIDLGKINMIYPENENIIWIGAADGLARFDMSALRLVDTVFQSVIRRITVSGDSVIYNGAGTSFVPEIHASYNDVNISFTSPYYNDELKNQFSWRLLGVNKEWTGWTNRRIMSYTNLREGKYEFQVRARNIYGDISNPSIYRMNIKPPWHRSTLAYLIYTIFAIGFVYMAVRLGQLRLRRKNERLEAIVQERTAEIREQNVELARQKKEITDSIYYAERIQRAILPHTDNIANLISGYFILFKPKDIVSGDFYWLAENGKKIIIAAVDCTGHGVPGAFMSMLGVSFLNKIILENNTLQADMILNQLRENVISSLKQTGKEGEARDGMDMALVVIDMENMIMEFAGANNPMYMIRGNEFNETKADRMPISFHIRKGDFVNHNILLKKGDCYYLFSDGYADQFGGPDGKKYKYKPFKQLLLDNKDKSMDKQKEILDDIIEDWKAGPDIEGKPYEQVDDILVIGIKI
jgi:serine phosphatase RsbU (regulator of sigma subunit)/ligand-binding sensor domain-containing protein